MNTSQTKRRKRTWTFVAGGRAAVVALLLLLSARTLAEQPSSAGDPRPVGLSRLTVAQREALTALSDRSGPDVKVWVSLPGPC